MKRLPLPLVIALAACGGGSTPTAKPATPQEEQRAPLPADLVWKDMNADQRHQFMKETVMPKAKEMFVAFDAEKYKDMNCKTCHGAGAEDGSFEMPNPKIKPLPSTPEAFMAWVQKDPEAGKYAQFMSQTLSPGMASLLHMTPFDPKTGTGEFGCANCHYMVDASGKVFKAPGHEHDHHDHGDGDHDHDD